MCMWAEVLIAPRALALAIKQRPSPESANKLLAAVQRVGVLSLPGRAARARQTAAAGYWVCNEPVPSENRGFSGVHSDDARTAHRTAPHRAAHRAPRTAQRKASASICLAHLHSARGVDGR